MTVLLILSNADSRYLIDAVNEGGVAVLERLYNHNKKECESAIIQLIKQKPQSLIHRPSTILSSLKEPKSDVFTVFFYAVPYT